MTNYGSFDCIVRKDTRTQTHTMSLTPRLFHLFFDLFQLLHPFQSLLIQCDSEALQLLYNFLDFPRLWITECGVGRFRRKIIIVAVHHKETPQILMQQIVLSKQNKDRFVRIRMPTGNGNDSNGWSHRHCCCCCGTRWWQQLWCITRVGVVRGQCRRVGVTHSMVFVTAA